MNMNLRDIIPAFMAARPWLYARSLLPSFTFTDIAALSLQQKALSCLMQDVVLGYALSCVDLMKTRVTRLLGIPVGAIVRHLGLQDERLQNSHDKISEQHMKQICDALQQNLLNHLQSYQKFKSYQKKIAAEVAALETDQAWIARKRAKTRDDAGCG